VHDAVQASKIRHLPPLAVRNGAVLMVTRSNIIGETALDLGVHFSSFQPGMEHVLTLVAFERI